MNSLVRFGRFTALRWGNSSAFTTSGVHQYGRGPRKTSDYSNDDVMNEVQGLYQDQRGRSRDIDDVIDEFEGQVNQLDRSGQEKRQQSAAKNTMIKRKIIQRKHFKEPQEINLLTWDSKEQIRYLNAEYPEEWGIDQLAESFPVSPKGVIRLLKSKWVPKNLQELIQHDKRVQNNWKALKSGNGTANITHEDLVKFQLMAHASGIASLPQPEQDLLYFPLERENPPGLFESMYLKTKGIEAQSETKSDPKAALKEHLEANVQLLKELAFDQTVQPEGQQNILSERSSSADDSHRRSEVLDGIGDGSVCNDQFADADLPANVDEDPGMAGTGRIQ